MQNRNIVWAPYLGALGIALIVGAFFLQIFFPLLPPALLLGLVGVGVILIAIYLFSRPREELTEAVRGRTAVYGSNSLLMALAFIGIIIAINFIASKQLHGRLDLTQNQQRTLSQQTVNVLKSLKEPVTVTGFFTIDQNAQQMQRQAESELKDYQLQTDKIQVKFVDPQANPVAARQYDIVIDGTLVFELGTRREKVTQFDENTFTNAILRVSQTQPPAVYFTTGHGELSPEDTNATGLSSIKTYLEQTNYKVQTLNLATINASTNISGGMPSDISALVIARPSKAFAPEDEQKVKQYLQAGGRVLLLFDPLTDPGLKDLLSSWGLALNNDVVVDPALNYRSIAAAPAVTNFEPSDITKDMTGYAAFFPGARSLKTASGSDKTPTELIKTTDNACGKTDLQNLQNLQQLQCDPAKDEKGPFALAYSVEAPATGGAKNNSRLIAVGNSTFATNQILTNPDGQGNGLLVTNMINWLAGQEDLIAVPPKSPSEHPLNAPTGQDQLFILVSSVVLIPLLVFIIGGLMWWRRRA
ncbi:MAG: GldG family protein [Rudaea sp.]